MRSFSLFTFALLVVVGPTAGALAEKYTLLTGVDARRNPGSSRMIFINPGPGVPGTFFDGDRLAGTADVGAADIAYVGDPGQGQPMYMPNEFGALSFLYRRGSVPLGPAGLLPFMGIEFLGGPLLDLDGDLDNGARSLVPVTGESAVEIPEQESFIELEFDLENDSVALVDLDVTGNNEGGPGQGPAIATVLITIAGTQPDGSKTGAINNGVDTRSGTATPFLGNSGTLVGVHRIEGLGYELWEDTLLNSPATGPILGTLQYLGTFDGWLIERGTDDAFPTLAGEGLGATPWPLVDGSQVGNTFATANGAAGGMATIASGLGGDDFTFFGNGGLALTDFGGDLGAYLDAVVLPVAPAEADRVVYLQSAGFGINNSFDPVFGDTVGYDAVIIAVGTGDGCAGFLRCDANCDGVVSVGDINAFVLALTQGQAAYEAAFPDCSFECNNDTNLDGSVTVSDINPFVECLTGV